MKTLEEYHLKYPARPGDTPEKFARYEEFCEENPCPASLDAYHRWYAALAEWMEWKRPTVSS